MDIAAAISACLMKSFHVVNMQRGHGGQQIGSVDRGQTIARLQARDFDPSPPHRFRT